MRSKYWDVMDMRKIIIVGRGRGSNMVSNNYI
jgi:hypothetical protein